MATGHHHDYFTFNIEGLVLYFSSWPPNMFSASESRTSGDQGEDYLKLLIAFTGSPSIFVNLQQSYFFLILNFISSPSCSYHYLHSFVHTKSNISRSVATSCRPSKIGLVFWSKYTLRVDRSSQPPTHHNPDQFAIAIPP